MRLPVSLFAMWTHGFALAASLMQAASGYDHVVSGYDHVVDSCEDLRGEMSGNILVRGPAICKTMKSVTTRSAAFMAQGTKEIYFHNVRIVVPEGGFAAFGATTVRFGRDEETDLEMLNVQGQMHFFVERHDSRVLEGSINDNFNTIILNSIGDLDFHDATVSYSKTRIVVAVDAVDEEVFPLSAGDRAVAFAPRLESELSSGLATSPDTITTTPAAVNEAMIAAYDGNPTDSPWATRSTNSATPERKAFFPITKSNRWVSKNDATVAASQDEAGSGPNLRLANPNTSRATDPSFATDSRPFDIPKKSRWTSILAIAIGSLGRKTKDSRERQKDFCNSRESRMAGRR